MPSPSKDKNSGKIVRTPGGEAPADKVHHVGPGQQVMRRPDGSHDIEDAPIDIVRKEGLGRDA